jgi:hypothetical protein
MPEARPAPIAPPAIEAGSSSSPRLRWVCDCCGVRMPDGLADRAREQGFVHCPHCRWPADGPPEGWMPENDRGEA